MSKEELFGDIYRASHLNGHFVLRSGQTSNEYFDKYMFESDPGILKRIATEMAGLLPDSVDFLAGLEMGGLPLATAIALTSGHKMLFVRKEAKTYGTFRLAEGCADLAGKGCV